MKSKLHRLSILAVSLCALAPSSALADGWSDTSVGYRYGTQFREPYVDNGAAISKSIYNLEYVGSYKYGVNFLNIDLLRSDHRDSNAEEIYAVYRNTIEYSKISNSKLDSSFFRDFGLTVGFDWNTKNDPGYTSKKQMLVAGPTIMLNVPGFVNISLLALNESNDPKGANRYTYKTHPCLNVVWGIPLGSTRVSFEGYADYITSKGTNEYGGSTSDETHVDAKIMYGVDAKNSLRVGVGYEYWRNKFGNPSGVPGSKATTPMIRAEYHF